MLLENLRVKRMAVHEIYRRKADKRPITPSYANELEILSDDASIEFRSRITEALSAQAKSLRMDIISFGNDSHLADVDLLIIADDKEFLHKSQKCADRLTAVQMAPGIPGGMLIVFDGTVGNSNIPFLGVIKAEMQTGFRRNHGARATITELLDDIFLTKATRLYKVGFIALENDRKKRPDDWTALVFDNNITQSHREAAAQYFFEAFLGCTFPSDGAYETGRFFDLTREFVSRSSLPQSDRRDVVDALFTFVKIDKSRTFTSSEFAEKYLPTNMRDGFSSFLAGRHFPTRAVVRDTSRMGSKLRRRRYKFGGDVELFVSPEAVSEKRVKIESGPAEKFGGEGKEIWTKIIVNQAVTEER